MSTDITCLIAEWPPIVASYRSCRGTSFYWNRPRVAVDRAHDDPLVRRRGDVFERYEDDPLPYATARRFSPGSHLLDAATFWRGLRLMLPPASRTLADAFLGMIWREVGEPTLDDLRRDAEHPGHAMPRDSGVFYAMRPATVREAVARGDRVPWDDVEIAGELELDRVAQLGLGSPYDLGCMDSAYFVGFIVGKQRAWLAEAASLQRGAVMLIH